MRVHSFVTSFQFSPQLINLENLQGLLPLFCLHVVSHGSPSFAVCLNGIFNTFGFLLPEFAEFEVYFRLGHEVRIKLELQTKERWKVVRQCSNRRPESISGMGELG
ncbi:hypothetical protein R1flu_010313 [Riccia fluitans]|uniref:Uncharacterized protein n=1 Tax=Riccia fluitans TaxID=41844 RepID=A0ABD1Z4M2_9MARC